MHSWQAKYTCNYIKIYLARFTPLHVNCGNMRNTEHRALLKTNLQLQNTVFFQFHFRYYNYRLRTIVARKYKFTVCWRFLSFKINFTLLDQKSTLSVRKDRIYLYMNCRSDSKSIHLTFYNVFMIIVEKN